MPKLSNVPIVDLKKKPTKFPKFNKPVTEIQIIKGWLGIDPGSKGCASLLYPDGSVNYFRLNKATEKDIWEWVWFYSQSIKVALIEQVSGYAGEKQPGSAMFNFGWGYGNLRMAIIGNGIRLEQVTPQRWQKLFVATKKPNESKDQHKKKLKSKAQQLFPNESVIGDTADSLLIAEYARRVLG